MLVGIAPQTRWVCHANEIACLPDETTMRNRNRYCPGRGVDQQVRTWNDAAEFLGGTQAVAQALVVKLPRRRASG